MVEQGAKTSNEQAYAQAQRDQGTIRDLRAELERHYTPEQVAELCFDVVKWSQQKALVATHIDAPPWEGIHVLDFDGDGHPLFAGPMADATRH